MGSVTGIVVYLVVWWLVWFCVLPWGVRRPDVVEKGQADGAPDNARLGLKFLVTTAIAAALWGVAFVVIEFGWINLREPL